MHHDNRPSTAYIADKFNDLVLTFDNEVSLVQIAMCSVLADIPWAMFTTLKFIGEVHVEMEANKSESALSSREHSIQRMFDLFLTSHRTDIGREYPSIKPVYLLSHVSPTNSLINTM